MKSILVMLVSLSLTACYYPTVKPEMDPVTKAPTGRSTYATSTGDAVYGAMVVGSAYATGSYEEHKKKEAEKKKKQEFPKPPEEVLKPMEK